MIVVRTVGKHLAESQSILWFVCKWFLAMWLLILPCGITTLVEGLVNVTTNSPSQVYTRLDDHTSLTFDMTPGFKPLTVLEK